MKSKVVVVTAVLFLFALPLFAPIYMKIDTIPGESQDPAHPGWIDVESFSWGVSHTPIGSGASTASRCSMHSFSFTKRSDKASPMLAKAALTGQSFPTLTLEMNGERHMLQNASIKSVQNGNGPNGPTQQITVDFMKCATHEMGAGLEPIKKASQFIKMNSNAFLTLTGRGNGDAVSLQDLHFNGPNQAVLTVRGAGDGANAILIGLLRASQAHQKVGTLSVKAKKPGTEEYMTYTMSDVLISGYQSGGSTGFDVITLNFGHLDGAMAPFHDIYIK
jgi:type VI protein secretion system component Hcp